MCILLTIYHFQFFQCIGFGAMFAYGYDALLKYRQYTSGPTNVIAWGFTFSIKCILFECWDLKWECLQIFVGFNVSERTNFQPRFGPIFEFSMEFGIFTSFILFVINFSDILTFAHFDIIFIGVFIFYHQDDEDEKYSWVTN